MTSDQWTELEKLAKAATPGPWECIRGNIVRVCQVGDADEFQREICVHYVNPDGGRNPEFMAAAHPQTILRLIALARSEAVLRDFAEAVYHPSLWVDGGSDLVIEKAEEALAESNRLRAGDNSGERP